MGLFSDKLTAKKLILVLLIIGLGSTAVMVKGAVYKVGDSVGWTASSNSSYANWASSKTFHVHDVLLFEYNATNDNVILVSHSEYRDCNISAPMKIYNSGNDSFTIRARGHYFFTSNFSGHCQNGQKLDIRVLNSSPPSANPPPNPATRPSPNPNVTHPAAAPIESTALAPSPIESKAATHDPKWLLVSTFGVAISGLVVLVLGFV